MKRPYLISIVSLFMMSLSAIGVRGEVHPINAINAIATIYTVDPSGKDIYQGTGFVVDQSGIIATNFHVVSHKFTDDKIPILVMLDEGVFFAEILSFDVSNDIALLKVEAKNLKKVELDERYRVKKGEEIAVLGFPSGEELILSYGNISNVFGMNELIQITAPVTYGNSGSPLLNSKGRVIGIVTFLINDEESPAFALPIRYAVRLLEKRL